jgi:hypothetical protein
MIRKGPVCGGYGTYDRHGPDGFFDFRQIPLAEMGLSGQFHRPGRPHITNYGLRSDLDFSILPKQ